MTIRKRGKTSAGSGRPDKSKRESAKKPARRPRRLGTLPPEGAQDISLSNAVELTQRYRKAAPASEHGGFFWADGIRGILAQPGCVGVRYYHGLDANGTYRIVLVGVDDQGNDMTGPTYTKAMTHAAKSKTSARSATAMLSATGESALLLEHHWPCPPYCSSGSPL